MTESQFELMEDLPPEYCRYRDEGCDLYSSCLDCPLPRCIYDEPGGRQHREKRRRNSEIVQLHNHRGEKIAEIARRFGLSKRTVYRILSGANQAEKGAFHE